ncbi:MAG: hypothetical protein PSX36_11735 [bacterium]|nr:hypothetical protein [bacterium]
MKKAISSVALIAVLIYLTGCIYESSVPIDEPSVKVSPKLLFTWGESGGDTYKFSRADDYTYTIDVTHTGTKKPEKLMAYASIVDDKTFLNVWDSKKKPTNRSYLLLKIKLLSDSTLMVMPLTENIREKFTSSADLKKFISENMEHSFFYEKDSEFKRIKTK